MKVKKIEQAFLRKIGQHTLFQSVNLLCKSLRISYENKNIVPNWLLVLYMSNPNFPPYRITVLNNMLSMESLSELSHEDEIIIKYIIGDLFDYDLKTKTAYKWETGRIFGLEPQDRETIIQFFIEKDVYLLGRYSTWNGKDRMDTTIIRAKQIVKTLCKEKQT